MILLYLLATWVVLNLLIMLAYHRDLAALWREPVFRYPILIVESDDWGAGPLSQAAALKKLCEILGRYQDIDSNRPVMTIAVILAVPDGQAIQTTGAYRRTDLGDPLFIPVREAIRAGAEGGVFALQLHGLEHYRPESLMASDDSGIRQWLTGSSPQATESLPAHLQSRWTDASRLPSKPLTPQEIKFAASEETSLFAEILGETTKVVVPPTFVWDDNVETAWANHGVEFVVTPGQRNTCRDDLGRPGCTDKVIRNGDTGEGVSYVVRNDYFEPEKGHLAGRALEALGFRWQQGRPCLLETHRSNFIGERSESAFEELDKLFETALQTHADLRFMSTLELGRAMGERSHPMLESNRIRRLIPWVARLRELPRFWKLARLTGLAILLGAVAFLAKPTGSEKKPKKFGQD